MHYDTYVCGCIIMFYYFAMIVLKIREHLKASVPNAAVILHMANVKNEEKGDGSLAYVEYAL